MPGSLKTEAIVLRSLRYGEADRILHLYTPHRGRIGAIAKGVRRTRSRFGGRLEPFQRVQLVLHEGRGELLTVTGVDTVATHGRLREHAPSLDAAARACDAVGRVFETDEPHPGVFQRSRLPDPTRGNRPMIRQRGAIYVAVRAGGRTHGSTERKSRLADDCAAAGQLSAELLCARREGWKAALHARDGSGDNC